MPSIETQTISAAVGSSIQPASPAQVRTAQAQATPQQVSQASQAIVDRTTLTPKDDVRRTTQIPKKTEGIFAAQRDKPEPDAEPEESEREPGPPLKGRLSLKV